MRFKRYLLPTALAVLALALVIAPDALAQYGLKEAAGNSIPTSTDIAGTIARILRIVVGFVGTIFLLLMVYAGLLWMTARGDSKKVDTAKQLITSAIIGIIIIGSAYAITAIVIATASGDSSSLGSGSSDETSSDEESIDFVPGGTASGGECVLDDDCDSGTCTGGQIGSCSNESDLACRTDSNCNDGGTCSGMTKGTCA